MPRIKHIVSVDYSPTFRSAAVEGMFDIPASQKLKREWDCDIPIEEKPWQVGLIVGASGSGKTTIANQLFPKAMHEGFDWFAPTLLDDFKKGLSVTDITTTLSQVGFSSPPSWLLPYAVLSNGQKFRAELARCLLEYDELFVFDEFTSVVDRQVAQIGAYAFQKSIRRTSKKFVAVTCHYDVEPWLQPDWVFDVSENSFKWGSVRRPSITFEIQRVHRKAWELFKEHHYLNAAISNAAVCFVAFIDGRPVAFDAWLPFFGKCRTGYAMRGHRTVVLPDFQGLGIGATLFTEISGMWKALGYQVFSNTGHPAEIRKRTASKFWKLKRSGMNAPDSNLSNAGFKRSTGRLTASFDYVGPAMDKAEALKLYANK